MPTTSRAVTVATTATRLDTAAASDTSGAGQSIALYNASSVSIFVGGSDVTTANGFTLAAGASLSIDLDRWGGAEEGLYGIVAAATAEVRVLEVGV